MSEKGISVLRPTAPGDTGIYHSPARAREVFDVSGAGDTVIATLAASLAAGLQIETAVELANLAAGIVVSKVGTVPIARNELVAALTPSSNFTAGEKILDLERITLRVAEWRATGETIVFTNGCFDLLHVGHITLLEDCRRFGSKLVLGLNADASVCRSKAPLAPSSPSASVPVSWPPSPPLMPWSSSKKTPPSTSSAPSSQMSSSKAATTRLKPSSAMKTSSLYGGRVEIVPTVEGFSTTNIVKKLTAAPASTQETRQ